MDKAKDRLKHEVRDIEFYYHDTIDIDLQFMLNQANPKTNTVTQPSTQKEEQHG